MRFNWERQERVTASDLDTETPDLEWNEYDPSDDLDEWGHPRRRAA